MDLKNSWMTDPRFYGQMAHALGGYSVMLTIAFLTGSIQWCAITWFFLMIVVAIKEFYYDTHFEVPAQDIKGGALDFSMYQLGAAIGFIVSVVKLIK